MLRTYGYHVYRVNPFLSPTDFVLIYAGRRRNPSN